MFKNTTDRYNLSNLGLDQYWKLVGPKYNKTFQFIHDIHIVHNFFF